MLAGGGRTIKRGDFMKREIIWPNHYQAAALVTIELDNEFIWTSIHPDHATPKTCSMGTYGTTRGIWRMLDILQNMRISATFFIPGKAAEQYPDIVRHIASAGHEIACHGYSHENFALLTPEMQKKVLNDADQAIMRITGCRPKGFRLPEGNCTRETLSLLADHGYLYDSSLHNHDFPYIMETNPRGGRIIEIPTHPELQDFPYFAFGPHFPAGESRIAVYDDVLDNWLFELNAVYNSGYCYVIKFDPQTIGSPGRIYMFDTVLQHLKSKNFWITTCGQISGYIRQVGCLE